MPYWAGTLVRVQAKVYDQTAVPPVLTDPDTLTYTMLPPGGAPSIVYTWPSDYQIVHTGTGLFYVDCDTTGSAAGTWQVTTSTTGVQAVSVNQFVVQVPPS